ncbi:MAG: hypothetical protein ACXVHQ_38050 [Solirubrobacteraceae bacterium]
MKRIIIAALVAATTTALVVALPTLAAGGTSNPLGVKIVCNATAYPCGDYIQACTITTAAQPIYNVRILNVGWPGGGPAYTHSVGDVRAHSTISATPNMGAWYVDPYSTVVAPTTYQSKSGHTYTIDAPITFTIVPCSDTVTGSNCPNQ